MHLLESPVDFKTIVVMVQREVAERMAARPSTKEYGALTLAVRFYCETEIVAYVPPNCFMPRPKVDSAVVRLNPLDKPLKGYKKALFFHIVRAAFNQRRKILANALQLYRHEEIEFTKDMAYDALSIAAIPAETRGEALDFSAFLHLTDCMNQIVERSHN
jgi:16S rRNA (adenine1518-N6/adenine1519-N6)-dimethyltransferase